MTYNLRFDNPGDGVNAWPKRKQKVFDLLGAHKPDLLGVQEALHHQLEGIITNLPQYAYVGVGRDDGQTKGEFSAILYNQERFLLGSSNTFWLSETPTVPGSKNWDAAITRVATWAKLYDKKLRDTIFVINTHFDHIGKQARENSAILIKKKIAELAGDLAVILTGDFNIEPSEPPFSILINKEIFSLADAGSGNMQGTFCTFVVNGPPCRRIDYILFGTGWKSRKYTVINQNDGRYYPSDHLPVMVQLKKKR
jgi:endonuclease/exonuclease/phosphatase family metal-dependent hydrolase